MAQHIVNIAFDFDDDKARQIAESTIDNEMHNIVKNIVLDKIAPFENTWYSNKAGRNWSQFNAKVDNQIRDFINENKDEIIERVASKVAESVKRTKAWKEKFEEVTR